MSNKRRRLFLALWPDSATRARLASQAHRHADRPVPDDNLHMTLAFLGSCDARQQQCIDKVVSLNIFQSFVIYIDYMDLWRRTGTLWLGTSEPPEALGKLVTGLRSQLSGCGFDFEKRAFVPHVTLSRKLPRTAVKTAIEPICWPVTDFVLAESQSIEGGVRYLVRRRWTLVSVY